MAEPRSSARCSATSPKPRRRSGSRRASPARSRSSDAASRPSRSAGHHYALVRIEGLEPGGFYEYEVALDGERRWPPPDHDLPPSAIRTFIPASRSTSASAPAGWRSPTRSPTPKTKDEDEEGHELDALHVLATQMMRGDRDEWPELLFLLGDQVYVDEGSPRDPGEDPRPPRHQRAARRGGDRLRGVHLALRGEPGATR